VRGRRFEVGFPKKFAKVLNFGKLNTEKTTQNHFPNWCGFVVK